MFPYRDFCEGEDPQKVDRFNDEICHTPKRQKFQPGQLTHTQRAKSFSPLQLQNRVKRHDFSNLRSDCFAAEVPQSLALIYEQHSSDSRDLGDADDVANACERLVSRD
jgi:hypothetical protein